jgi:hypothetical protein
MDGNFEAQGLRPTAQDADSQLDRELEAALGIEPSPEFLARARMRVASEQPVESGFSRIRHIVFEPLWAMGIVGIVVALVVPNLFQPTPSGTQMANSARPRVDTPLPATGGGANERPAAPLREPHNPRRSASQPVAAVTADAARGPARLAFESRVLLAPDEREGFDHLLTVVNDPTIELIAPVLESTRASADVIDAFGNLPTPTALEGASQ